VPIEQRPLTVNNFADGRLVSEVDEKIALILERFTSAEDGAIKLASDKATIAIKLHIVRDPQAGGFRCFFEEPHLNLPRKISEGTVAIVRDGILVVSIEAPAEQLSLLKSHKSDT